MVKGYKHSPEALEKIRRARRFAAERRKRRLELEPRHLKALRTGESLHPLLAVVVDAARREHDELLHALGGPDHVTPQRRAILEDLVQVGIVLRSELMRYAQTRDPDSVTRITSATSARRASLQALGLERIAHEVPSLEGYVASRAAENGSGATHADLLEPEVESDA